VQELYIFHEAMYEIDYLIQLKLLIKKSLIQLLYLYEHGL